jgi:Caspase domain
MMRMLLSASLIAGLVVAESGWAMGQDGPGTGSNGFPPPGMLEPVTTTTPPINTEALDGLLPAPDDDGDDIEIVPEDIRDTKLTILRGEGFERLWVDALMVIDTHATGQKGSLAPALLKDAKNMESMLRSIGIQPTILRGNDARPDVIRRHYARLRQSPNRPHVLIFYSTSHGRSNPQRKPRGDLSHGHVLDFDDGRAPMWHASVRKMMLSVRPSRLAVIMTDSCSSQRSNASLAYGGSVTSQYARQVLRSLFLDHTGVVDMNSSSLGQYSSCNPYTGSAFTYGLFQTIANGSGDQLDVAPRDGVISWDEVFRSVRTLVADGSDGRQVPEMFSRARPR